MRPYISARYIGGVKFIVLGLLLYAPLTLYDLQKRFAAGLVHIYGASFGSLHRVLGQLVELGYAELAEATVGKNSNSGRQKKIYRATSAGRKAFREWMLNPGASEPLEQAMLGRIYFLGLMRSHEERAQVIGELRALNSEAMSVLHGVQSRESSPADGGPISTGGNFGPSDAYSTSTGARIDTVNAALASFGVAPIPAAATWSLSTLDYGLRSHRLADMWLGELLQKSREVDQ